MLIGNSFTADPRVYNEARSLIRAGHRVTVIAFDREKKNLELQYWDEIKIVRVKTGFPPRPGFGRRLWNAFMLLQWQWRAYKKAVVLNKQDAIDIVHCHDFDTLLSGIWIKKTLGLPLIYDAHEIYAYPMARTAPDFVVRIFLWFEKYLIGSIDRIINVSEPQKRYYESITCNPISLIMNCKLLLYGEYQPPQNEGRFTILYIGHLNKQRSIEELIDVVKDLPDVHCIIGGAGNPTYSELIEEKCIFLTNADFIGIVPFDQVMAITKDADIIFCMFDPSDLNSQIGMPNKLFEAMVCGRPIICTKGIYSGEVTEREEIGLAIEYTKEALKQAIIKLRDDPALRDQLGRNALKAAITKFNWQIEEKKLLELYHDIQEDK
jgi:glycosyltransferase involved in cell wall biosynthesis